MSGNPLAFGLGRSTTNVRPAEVRSQQVFNQVYNGNTHTFMDEFDESRAHVAENPERFENNMRALLVTLA